MLKNGELSKTVTYNRAVNQEEHRQKVIANDSQEGTGEFQVRFGCRTIAAKDEGGEF